MPRFLVTTTATATIREQFIVEAIDAEAAEAVIYGDSAVGEIVEVLPDETIGDETARDIESVEEYTGEGVGVVHYQQKLARDHQHWQALYRL